MKARRITIEQVRPRCQRREIREYREAYAKKFRYDPHAIFEDIRRRERESGRTSVSLPPKPLADGPGGQALPSTPLPPK